MDSLKNGVNSNFQIQYSDVLKSSGGAKEKKRNKHDTRYLQII